MHKPSIADPSCQTIESTKNDNFDLNFYAIQEEPPQSITTKPVEDEPAIPDAVNQMIWGPYTERNVEGRKRVVDGILTPGPNTEYVTAQDDKSKRDFVLVDNLISPAEIKFLYEAFDKSRHLFNTDNIPQDYWKNRILFSHQIKDRFPEAFRLMHESHRRIHKEIAAFYKIKAPIYADTVQLVSWSEGLFLPPHSDNCHPDNRPNNVPWRTFGSIVYLNDDFEGGEVYLTGLDKIVKPKAGMLIAFTGGTHHEHGVLKITKGERVTMPSFHTFDASKADKPHLY
jgi:hypothetical protein